MKFLVSGDVNKPVILLIHAMFCNAESCLKLVQHLGNGYRIILPVLDGHCNDHSVYISKEQEAEKILCYLKEQGITEVALLHGTSMGAEVAMEVFRGSSIPIRKCFFDGGPFFKFPGLVQKIMLKKFTNVVDKIQRENDIKIEKIMSSFMIRRIVGKHAERYKGALINICTVCRDMKQESVVNLTKTCYDCDLPLFSIEDQRKMVFLFCKKEPARLSENRLKKRYPESMFIEKEGYNHCGYQIVEPEAYAAMLLRILEE